MVAPKADVYKLSRLDFRPLFASGVFCPTGARRRDTLLRVPSLSPPTPTPEVSDLVWARYPISVSGPFSHTCAPVERSGLPTSAVAKKGLVAFLLGHLHFRVGEGLLSAAGRVRRVKSLPPRLRVF